jgi:hypothetical protein
VQTCPQIKKHPQPFQPLYYPLLFGIIVPQY